MLNFFLGRFVGLRRTEATSGLVALPQLLLQALGARGMLRLRPGVLRHRIEHPPPQNDPGVTLAAHSWIPGHWQ